MPSVHEFSNPLPPREQPTDPLDSTCGHRHPPGQPCWGVDDGEPCIHSPRCLWCGNSIQMDDNHEIKRGPPTDSRIHKECLRAWVAEGEPGSGPPR